jgi:hypothetical protein
VDLSRNNFDVYSSVIENFSAALEHFAMETNETMDEYMKRLIEEANKKRKTSS